MVLLDFYCGIPFLCFWYFGSIRYHCQSVCQTNVGIVCFGLVIDLLIKKINNNLKQIG